ncbi:hypothetical protein ACSJL4_001934 [Serratia nematodiphila]
MSDSSGDGVLESVKKAFTDRINTPLFGFIFISWLVFNWDNILFVMLSEVTIEKRINAIKLDSAFYFKGLICPIFSGYFLSVAFPYLQLSVTWLQKKALPFMDANKDNAREREYNSQINLAKSKAGAEIANELAKAEVDVKLAQERNLKANLDYSSESLKEEFLKYRSEVDALKKEYNELKAEIYELQGRKSEIGYSVENLSMQEKNLNDKIGSSDKLRREAVNLANDIYHYSGIIKKAVESYKKMSSLEEHSRELIDSVNENLQYIEDRVIEQKKVFGLLQN